MPETLSDARRDLVRARVFAGVETVLAAGEDLTFARVAAAAGIPERTVYRHFPTRLDLLSGAYAWANERIGITGRARTGTEAGELVRTAFPAFDAMAPVVRELLRAPEGLAARLAENEDRQRAALDLVREELPDIDAKAARRLAAVIQLLGSAAAWQSLHDYWDMDGAEAAESCALAIDVLLGAEVPRRRKRSSG